MTTASPGQRLGLLGRKVGMMRIFTDSGDSVPVTVLDVSNNRVTQVKTVENDGYSALQVAYGSRKASRVSKPQAGHLAKAGVEAGEILKEFRVAADVADVLVRVHEKGEVVPLQLRPDRVAERGADRLRERGVDDDDPLPGRHRHDPVVPRVAVDDHDPRAESV